MRTHLLPLVIFVTGALAVSAQVGPPPRLTPLDATGRVTYFVADGIERSGHRPGDTELVTWALHEWEAAAGGALRFERSDVETSGLIRIYWLPWAAGEIGHMRPIRSLGRVVSTVFLRPDTNRMGDAVARRVAADLLMRDVIVYHLSLHELGHALGLGHSTDSADIMVARPNLAVYERYRRLVDDRAAIRRGGWLSAGDTAAIRALYQR